MNRTNTLIQVSEDYPISKGTEPTSNIKERTIPIIQYDVLIKSPYKYEEIEFHKQVHYVIRKKPHLNISQYDIRRNALCKKWGWGIHVNEDGKLALVGCETEKYKELVKDCSIKKVRAYKQKK